MASDTNPLFVIRAVAKAMWVTLFNLFRKPVTVHYPDIERAYPDRYRGLLALVYEKDTGEEACIGCRLCEYVCPPAVIKVEMLKSEKRNYAKSFSLLSISTLITAGGQTNSQSRQPMQASSPVSGS